MYFMGKLQLQHCVLRKHFRDHTWMGYLRFFIQPKLNTGLLILHSLCICGSESVSHTARV